MFNSKDFSHLSNHHKNFFRVAAAVMILEIVLVALALIVMLAGFAGYVSITAWLMPMWVMVAILVLFGAYTFVQHQVILRDSLQQQDQSQPQGN